MPFLRNFHWGGEGKSKNYSEIWNVKFAFSIVRPPEWCELGRLGMCGKLHLKEAPGGGELFLLYFSLKSAEKKVKDTFWGNVIKLI